MTEEMEDPKSRLIGDYAYMMYLYLDIFRAAPSWMPTDQLDAEAFSESLARDPYLLAQHTASLMETVQAAYPLWVLGGCKPLEVE